MNMPQNFDTGLMWFRRDLRVMDNAALHLALSQCVRVHCVFVFDHAILASLPPARPMRAVVKKSVMLQA